MVRNFKIVKGTPPYDGVAAVFVSHAHGDHFSPSIFNRLLAMQAEIRLIAPVQAVDKMREDEGWDPVFATRITALSLENGEQAEPIEIAGVTAETPDPFGGHFYREDGELTGKVAERARAVFNVPGGSTREERAAGVGVICREMNATGLTSVHQAGTSSTAFACRKTGGPARSANGACPTSMA